MSNQKVSKSRKQRLTYRYSMAFKQKIVSEIESGAYTVSEIRVKYGIGGGNTIQRWIKKLGKNHLLSKKIRIEMPDELSEIKKLQSRIAELEQGLVQTQLENISNRSYLELACQDLGIDIEIFKKKQAKKHT